MWLLLNVLYMLLRVLLARFDTENTTLITALLNTLPTMNNDLRIQKHKTTNKLHHHLSLIHI